MAAMWTCSPWRRVALSCAVLLALVTLEAHGFSLPNNSDMVPVTKKHGPVHPESRHGSIGEIKAKRDAKRAQWAGETQKEKAGWAAEAAQRAVAREQLEKMNVLSTKPEAAAASKLKAHVPSCEHGKAEPDVEGFAFTRHETAKMEVSETGEYSLLGYKIPDVNQLKHYANTDPVSKQLAVDLPPLIVLDIYRDMTWKKAKAEMKEEADLRAYGAYRQMFVNTLLINILKTHCPTCEFGISGSTNAKSDYDVSVKGPYGDKAVKIFNCNFEAVFGMTSSDKFGYANIYAASFFESTSSWKQKPQCLQAVPKHPNRMWVHIPRSERGEAVNTQHVMAMGKLQYFMRQFLGCPLFDIVTAVVDPTHTASAAAAEKKTSVDTKEEIKHAGQQHDDPEREAQEKRELERQHRQEQDREQHLQKQRAHDEQHRSKAMLKYFNRFMYHSDNAPDAPVHGETPTTTLPPRQRRNGISSSSYFVGGASVAGNSAVALSNPNPVVDSQAQTAAGQQLLKSVWDQANALLATIYTEPCKDPASHAACIDAQFEGGKHHPVFDMSNKAWRNELYARKLQTVYDMYQSPTSVSCHEVQKAVSVTSIYGMEMYWSAGAFLHVVGTVQEKMTDMRLPRSVFLDSFMENLGGALEVLMEMRHDKDSTELAKIIELSKYENRLADAALIMYADVAQGTEVKIQTGANSMNEAATCLNKYTTEMKAKFRGKLEIDVVEADKVKQHILDCHKQILALKASQHSAAAHAGAGHGEVDSHTDAAKASTSSTSSTSTGTSSTSHADAGGAGHDVEQQVFDVLMALAEDVISTFFVGAASSAWRDNEVSASALKPLWENMPDNEQASSGTVHDDNGHEGQWPALPRHGSSSTSSSSSSSHVGADVGATSVPRQHPETAAEAAAAALYMPNSSSQRRKEQHHARAASGDAHNTLGR